MHAIPLNYNDHVLVPLAAGERGSFASMVIVTKPNGARWASGVLGHFSEADDACRFAIEYGKAEVDGRRRPRVLKPIVTAEPDTNRTDAPCVSGSVPWYFSALSRFFFAHCALRSGFFLFRAALMFMVQPAHVMRIEPFTHTHRCAGILRMVASIPATQHSRNNYQDRQAQVYTGAISWNSFAARGIQ
jgi:hypothetical protein